VSTAPTEKLLWTDHMALTSHHVLKYLSVLNLGWRKSQDTPYTESEIRVSIKLTFPKNELRAAGDRQSFRGDRRQNHL